MDRAQLREEGELGTGEGRKEGVERKDERDVNKEG